MERKVATHPFALHCLPICPSIRHNPSAIIILLNGKLALSGRKEPPTIGLPRPLTG